MARGLPLIHRIRGRLQLAEDSGASGKDFEWLKNNVEIQLTRFEKASRQLEEFARLLEENDLDAAKAYLVDLENSDLKNSFEFQSLVFRLNNQLREQELGEETVEKLYNKAQEYFEERLFETARNIITAMKDVGKLPADKKIYWDVQVNALTNEINASDEVWGMFAKAKARLTDIQRPDGLAIISEVNSLIEKVISYSPRNGVIESIQDEAIIFKTQALVNQYLSKREWGVVKNLIRNDIYTKNRSVDKNSKLYIQILAIENIENLSQQVKSQAAIWFILTITFAIVAASVFIGGLILSFQSDKTYAILSGIAGILSTIFSTLFLNQCNYSA